MCLSVDGALSFCSCYPRWRTEELTSLMVSGDSMHLFKHCLIFKACLLCPWKEWKAISGDPRKAFRCRMVLLDSRRLVPTWNPSHWVLLNVRLGHRSVIDYDAHARMANHGHLHFWKTGLFLAPASFWLLVRCKIQHGRTWIHAVLTTVSTGRWGVWKLTIIFHFARHGFMFLNWWVNEEREYILKHQKYDLSSF